jgi:Tol biopolymer transport system component
MRLAGRIRGGSWLRTLVILTCAAAALGCRSGSTAVTLGRFVPAPRVAAELAVGTQRSTLDLASPGRAPRPLSVGGSLQAVDDPAWSPDGRWIAFTAATRAPPPSGRPLLPPTDMYVVSATGGGLRRLTTGRDAVAPAWSPDGRWIAYTAITIQAGVRRGAMWIVHPDGTGRRMLTAAVARRFDLAGPYNPRTGAIAFARCTQTPVLANGFEPDTCTVWTMRPDGRGQRLLARQSEDPAWSPDGRRIVFASARDHAKLISVGEDEASWIRQLYVMDADGRHQRRLLKTTTSDRSPTWAPGGRIIAYQTSTDRPFETAIAITTLDGSCHALIGAGDTAAWRPGGLPATGAICAGSRP